MNLQPATTYPSTGGQGRTITNATNRISTPQNNPTRSGTGETLRSDDLREHTDTVARNPREAAPRPRLCDASFPTTRLATTGLPLAPNASDRRRHLPRTTPANRVAPRPPIPPPYQARKRDRTRRRPTRNTQHATRNTQHATRNTQRATRNAQRATLNAQRSTQTRNANAQRSTRQLSMRVSSRCVRLTTTSQVDQPRRLTCPLFGSQLEVRRTLKLVAHAQSRLPLTRRSHRAPRRDEILAGSRHPGCESSPLPCRAHLTCTLPRFADRGRFA
jgi:hypothetical protein